MNDVLFTPVRLIELETLIENSVAKAFLKFQENLDALDNHSFPWTVEKTAKELDISKNTVYKKISNGELPVIKRNGDKRVYIDQVKLLADLKANQRPTKAEIRSMVSLSKNK